MSIKIGTRILQLIFPPRCVNCRENLDDGVVCGECFDALHQNRALFCGKCGSRLAENKKVCHHSFPYILGAAGNYSDPIMQTLIRKLKFDGIREAASPLAYIMITYAEALLCVPPRSIVIPIPLGTGRRRERGFNQSEDLARSIASHFNVPLDCDNLMRTRNTLPQAKLKKIAERKKNIRGCFAVKNPGALRGASVLLIDDVTTTGSTLFEAAATLKDAGARRIVTLVAARA